MKYWLTLAQYSMISDLDRDRPGIRLAFAGIDGDRRPVVIVQDVVTTVMYAVKPRGGSAAPFGTVRGLDDEELESLPERDSILLFGLPNMLRSPELPEGEWLLEDGYLEYSPKVTIRGVAA